MVSTSAIADRRGLITAAISVIDNMVVHLHYVLEQPLQVNSIQIMGAGTSNNWNSLCIRGEIMMTRPQIREHNCRYWRSY
jgi:hypothetical protein